MKQIEGYSLDFDFNKFKRIADLIYFDGPFLSHYISDKGEDYLFYWGDQDEWDNRWLVMRVTLPSLQKFIGKEVTLREMMESPNDGFLYCVDVNDDLVFHDAVLVRPSSLPDDYFPASDSYYEFEPVVADDATELMTYELTIPTKERNRFEDLLHKIGIPVSSLKKMATKAAVF